jgi:hypothetical protein
MMQLHSGAGHFGNVINCDVVSKRGVAKVAVAVKRAHYISEMQGRAMASCSICTCPARKNYSKHVIP